MPSFFDKQFSEQVRAAINSSDPKLLQILLSTKYCQLGEDWLARSILSHKIVGIIQTLKYQLPINIIAAQKQVLDKNFGRVIYGSYPTRDSTARSDELVDVRANNDDVEKVNKELENVKQEILQRYKSFRHEIVDDEYKIFNVQDMFDPAGKFVYFYNGNDYTEGNKCLKEVTAAFKGNLALQPVLKLDLSSHYSEIYDEMYTKITEQYQLRIMDGQSVRSLYQGNESLIKKLDGLIESDNRLRSMLTSISKEVVDGIRNSEFIKEVYDKLIDNVLNIAAKERHHPLYQEFNNVEGDTKQKIEVIKERIKEQVKRNSQLGLLKECMKYAADKDRPSVHIINVLIANGASLLASYAIDPKTNQSITVKERLQKLGGEYKALIDKLVFTITRKVHKLVFDFSIIGKEGVDLLKLVSEIPSEDGYFVESSQKITLFNKIGSEGASEFMDLLRACAKEINLKETFAMVRGISSKKEFEEACAKLYDYIEVDYLAIKTRGDKVIVDYLSEIDEEARQSRNPHLKKLYGRFYTILSEYNDLPKSIFLVRWLRYLSRTVKSYSGW